MSHFPISFVGNKRKEFKYIEPLLNFDGIENIIEPFCGSSAISFNIWLKHPHLNFYLNDNFKTLINLYQLLKTNDINDIYDKINEYKLKYNDPVEFRKFAEESNCKSDDVDAIIYIFLKKTSRFRIGENLKKEIHYSTKPFVKPTKLQLKFIEFVKSPNVHISNDDWSIIFDKFKNNDKTIFFFDPPYIDCDNSFYNKTNVNKFDYNVYDFFTQNKINTFNSHIYFILELIDKNTNIFGNDNIITTYNKYYNMSYKTTKHAIYTNKRDLKI
jgi:hypothetical protein